MNASTKRLCAVVVAVALGTWLLRATFAPVGREGNEPVDNPAASAAVSGAMLEGERALAAAIEQMASQQRDVARPGMREKPLRSETDGCEWPNGSRASKSSLADQFLMGDASSRVLMMHVILNPEFRPLCPEDVRSLDDLVGKINTVMNPVVSAFAEIRTRELISLIDSGRLSPWIPDASTSPRSVAVHPGFEGPLPAGDRDDRVRPRGSFISHKGQFYLLPAPDMLPRSVAYFENVKFVAGENLRWAVGWFVSMGYMIDPANVIPVVQGIEARKL